MIKRENLETKAVAKHDWHALPAEAVAEALGTSADGISESAVEERTKVYGRNEFTEGHEETIWERVFAQLRSPLTLILLAAAVITYTFDEHVDSAVILLAVLVAVAVGVVQEGKASRAFKRLANSQVRVATVIRAGKKHEILAADLVPGDVVVLQSGGQVPADIRLFETKKLSINEAALTGEWLAVKKGIERVSVGTPLADLTSMAWMGTFIAEGYGMGYVVATGDYTAVGKLAKELSDVVEEQTPLQRQMAKISQIMLYIVITLIVGIFLIGMTAGHGLEEMLLTAIAIAVASIPEGLPAAVTIILAVGMEALLSRGGLVRNLLAAETLGSTTFVLTDKTGTLTEGRMAVTDVGYAGCQDVEYGSTCHWQSDPTAHKIFSVALCASDAYLDQKSDEDGSFAVRGEPMERAILEAAMELEIVKSGKNARANRVDYLAFTSEQRYAAGVTKSNGQHVMCINGAPEFLLDQATHVHTEHGVEVMSTSYRKYFNDLIARTTSEGKRLMGVAYKAVDAAEVPEDGSLVLRDTTFAGVLIFADPVRKGVADAIAGVQSAGAEIRLVTGDNPATALTIARAVGIAREHDVALTGEDIAERNDEELLEALKTVRVFARVLPRQKMRLARVLQQSGEVVAMTGDGINDAPALQKANIGIAIGSGTEVAKEASDLVLIKDSFATIYAAIEEGRRIISNLRKIVTYLLSTSLTEAVLIAAALIIGAPIPILPVQILWANMIEEGLMSVAFAFEKGDKNAMKEKPQDIREEGVLSRDVLIFIGGTVALISILLVSLYFYVRSMGLPLEQLRSVMFLAISIDSLFIAFSFRSLKTPIWNIPFKNNKFFFISFFTNWALLGVVVMVPFFHTFLSYTPLPMHIIWMPVVYGLCAMVAVEVGKWLFFERKRAA